MSDDSKSPTDAELEEASRRLAEQFGVGATGKHPEPKINPNDEGELRVGIGQQGDKIVIHFGKKVAWVALSKDQTLEFAAVLEARANTMK